MKIAPKLISGLFIIVGLFTIVCFFSIETYHRKMKQEKIEDSVRLARTITLDMAIMFENRINQFERDIKLLDLSGTLNDSNSDFLNMPEAHLFIQAVDADWKAGKDTEFIRKLMENEVSQKLKSWEHLYYEGHNHTVFTEAMLLNKFGVIVGTTGKTTDYFQADEAWFQAAVKSNELWVGEYHYDESARIYGSNVVIPIYDSLYKIVGYLKLVVDVDELAEHLEDMASAQDLSDKDITLLSFDGIVIFSSEKNHEVYKKINKWELISKKMLSDSGFFEMEGDYGKGQEIIAYGVSKHMQSNESGLVVLLEEELSLIDLDATKLRYTLLVALGMTVLLVLLVGIYIAHSISSPIIKLQNGMADVAMGRFDARVDINSKDEVGMLAASFNRMAAALTNVTVSRDNLQLEISRRIELEEELKKAATTDRLTGAYNRLKFDEVIEAEIGRVKRYGHPLSLIILDIDWFKKVNDTHGHLAGDSVLKELSAFVLRHKRETDFFFRWGGEEFVIIASETDIDDAFKVSDRLRSQIQKKNFDGVEEITVSIGVTEYIKGEDVDDMLSRADEALYIAKEGGRNRVHSI